MWNRTGLMDIYVVFKPEGWYRAGRGGGGGLANIHPVLSMCEPTFSELNVC